MVLLSIMARGSYERLAFCAGSSIHLSGSGHAGIDPYWDLTLLLPGAGPDLELFPDLSPELCWERIILITLDSPPGITPHLM